jgi:recombination protein RecA
VIEKKGSWFYFNEEKIGQGREATKKTLMENQELFNKVKEATLNK